MKEIAPICKKNAKISGPVCTLNLMAKKLLPDFFSVLGNT